MQVRFADIPLWLSEGIAIYFETPAHTLSNHQACVRYRSKLRLLIGLARRMVESSGAIRVPAVMDDLGHLVAIKILNAL